MTVIYILAFVAIVFIVVHYVRGYYNHHEEDHRSEEEKAKEEVESMIVHSDAPVEESSENIEIEKKNKELIDKDEKENKN